MEADSVNEVAPVPKTPCHVLHPLDLGMNGLTGRLGDPVPQVGDDVFEATFQHPSHLDHRL